MTTHAHHDAAHGHGCCAAGDAKPGEAKHQMLRGVEQLSQALTDHDSRSQLATATEALLDDQFYQALKALRTLLPREARLLAATPR